MKKNQQLALNFEEKSKTEVSPAKTKKSFELVGGMFEKYQLEDKGGYITQEFQDFGYRLALELGDTARTSLYMRLAKSTKRALLEQALSFVADAPNVKNKAALFMWKLKELKNKSPGGGTTASNSDKT
ncbi:MAG: hypothetical protein QG639_842 [Patescibacteria group bacterium]|jgi:hypothetical protein|nr:hypothetical protein [Patescibacteria group bacterium]